MDDMTVASAACESCGLVGAHTWAYTKSRTDKAQSSAAWPLVCGDYGSPRRWWLRVKGHGVRVLPLAGHNPNFSERYGYRKASHVRVLGVCIVRIKP